MKIFSKRKLIICLFCIIIFICLGLFLILTKLNKFKKNDMNDESQKEIVQIAEKDKLMEKQDDVEKYKDKYEELNEEKIEEIVKEEILPIQYKSNSWRIFIPKIYLDAPILEGTKKEILRKAVGHFENTSKWDGNVVLAAHNRGYKYNYFEGLKRLNLGDEIIYQTDLGVREYQIVKKEKVKETDLSCLEDTKDNKLTLITCVENMPEYRLCIQASLKKY